MAHRFQRTFGKPMVFIAIIGIFLLLNIPIEATGQTLEKDRLKGFEMLNVIRDDIRKYYYDPSFRGIDIDALFKSAEEKIARSVSMGETLAILARTLMMFDDAHTAFIIPPPAVQVEQGWELQMIRDKCFVVAVKPGSDAERQDLRPGDEILLLGGNIPKRKNLSQIMYFLQYQMSIPVVVRRAGADQRSLNILAKVQGPRPKRFVNVMTASEWPEIIRQWEMQVRFYSHRFHETEDTLIWKMPAFDKNDDDLDGIMSKARKRKSLIIDLRGNSGGRLLTLLRLVGHLFDRDLQVGQVKKRSATLPLMAKTIGNNRVFKGKLIVLVDSDSGSASEVLARIIQLEKRGVVIGDRTAGKVMGAVRIIHESGGAWHFYYGTSITVEDLLLSDGKSLERTGVTPDEVQVPTPEAMAAGWDPVMSRAMELAGLSLDPKKAAALFPVKWRP